ncbi:MAG: DUF6455 family protein [Rhodobacteraceae bacterium]|nr:DUF6455 family protein [Paracoccaceae bacterium]
MQKLGDPMTHVRLMTQMGRNTGVDLVRAQAEGLLSQEDWADLVQSCRACDWGARCDDWLAQNPEAEHAPDTCPNRKTFARLRAALKERDNV